MNSHFLKESNNACGVFDLYCSFLKHLNAKYYQHAINVGYLMYCSIKDSSISLELKYKLIYVSMLHDIGAFERNNTENVYKLISDFMDQHSKKGYLYLKYYTPFSDLAKIVLYHHASYKHNKLDYEYSDYVHLLHIIDWFDVSLNDYGYDEAVDNAKYQEDNLFSKEQINNFLNVLKVNNCKNILEENKCHDILREYLSTFEISNKDFYDQVNGLAFIYERHDNMQIGHSNLVGFLSRKLGEILGLSKEDCDTVAIAGVIHDFGKIMVSSSILKKAFKLTKEEKQLLNQHVTNTLELIKDIFSDDVYEAIKYHHEQVCGKGYPFGIKGDEIPLFSKILTTANRYSVVYEKRVYEGQVDYDVIMNELFDLVNKGILDNKIVTVIDANKKSFGEDYKELLHSLYNIKNAYSDENQNLSTRKSVSRASEYFLKDCLKDCSYIDNSNFEYLFDNLTRVLNRDTITKYLEYLIDAKKPFTLGLLDVDNFKNINDNYGHLVGDEVLIQFTKALVRAMGDIGLIGRYGGDEFMIILPNKVEYTEVWNIFHSVNTEINSLRFKKHEDLLVTATTGVSRYPENATTYNKLIETSDKALYRGKQKGRNCFIVYLESKHSNIVREGIQDKIYSSTELQTLLFDKLTKNTDLKQCVNDTIKFIKDVIVFEHLAIENDAKIIYEHFDDTAIFKTRYPLPIELIKEALDDNTYFYTNTSRSLPKKKSNLKSYMNDFTIDAFILCEISAYGKKFGYLRIDCTSSKLWQNNEIDLIISLAKLLGTILYLSHKELKDIF